MAALPQSAIALIESGAHGHLVTINPDDGSLQVSMVWVGIEGGELCVASLTPRQKLRNACGVTLVSRSPSNRPCTTSPASAAPAGCASISASGGRRASPKAGRLPCCASWAPSISGRT